MKYMVSARPGPMPPSPEQLDAAMEWVEERLDDGTFDCVYGFMSGGGFSISNHDSHGEVLELMAEYPLYGLVTWEIEPLLEFKQGYETIRAKLVEAQEAIAA